MSPPDPQHAPETNDASIRIRIGAAGRAWRWFEMGVLFFGVPALLAAMLDPARRFEPVFRSIGLGSLFDLPFPASRLIFPVLLVTTAGIVAWLLLDRSFETRRLWNFRAARRDARRIGTIFAASAVLIAAGAWWVTQRTDLAPPGAFFRLPRELPVVMLLICVFYPWLSAYPQEITHRAFFFHRYGVLFGRRWVLIGVNALAFMWLHVIFWNWIALGLTLVGGVLFAVTYERTKSTLAAGLEHALYGLWTFATGLGWFLFAGGIGRPIGGP